MGERPQPRNLMRPKTSALLLLVGMMLAPSAKTWAQSATYEFTGTPNGDNQLNSVTTAPSGGTFSTFTRSGPTFNAGANVFNSTSWSTGASIDLAKYVGYTVTPSAGNISFLKQISFDSQR